MHYRQRIRDALKVALTGRTAAGANVFTSRARPILEIVQRRKSVLSVYTADESSERDGTGHLLDRKLQVTVEGMMGGGDDLDDQLDSLAAEVEAVIDADPTLGFLLSEDLVLSGTATEITARGNMQVGAFRLDFECSYQTERVAEPALAAQPPSIITVPPTRVSARSEPVTTAFVELASAQSGVPAESSLADTATLGRVVEQPEYASPADVMPQVKGAVGCNNAAWGGEA